MENSVKPLMIAINLQTRTISIIGKYVLMEKQYL